MEHRIQQPGQVGPGTRLVVGLEVAEVGPGAKGPPAPGEDDGPALLAGTPQSSDERGAQLGVDGVVAVGPVEGYRRDLAVQLVKDAHSRLLEVEG